MRTNTNEILEESNVAIDTSDTITTSNTIASHCNALRDTTYQRALQICKMGRLPSGDPQTKESRNALRQIFDHFDRNGDNQIDSTELHHVISALGVRLARADAAKVMSLINGNTNGGVSFNEFSRFKSLRVIEPVRDTSIIDTRYTVASIALGMDSRLEQSTFNTAVHASNRRGRLLWITWYIGLLVGISSQQSLVLPWYPARYCLDWSSLLLLPLPCVSFAVLSVDLIKEIILEGEFYALLALEVSWLYSAIRLLQDIRCLYWACLMPSILVAALSDAYPAKFRATFQKLFFGGLIITMIWWNLALTLSLNDPISTVDWKFGRLSGSTATASVLNTFTAMAFACRNLYNALRHPNRFVVISSRARTKKINLKDLVDGPTWDRPEQALVTTRGDPFGRLDHASRPKGRWLNGPTEPRDLDDPTMPRLSVCTRDSTGHSRSLNSALKVDSLGSAVINPQRWIVDLVADEGRLLRPPAMGTFSSQSNV